MSIKTTLAIAAFSILAAGSAFAVEATRDFDNQTLSTKSRAEVVTELRAAQRAGSINSNEGSPAQVAQSTLTRVQIIAEAREAQRLGLTGGGEIIKFATPEQSDLIRMAGERAVAPTVAALR